jgi:iron complex outermembrane recepter protein
LGGSAVFKMRYAMLLVGTAVFSADREAACAQETQIASVEPNLSNLSIEELAQLNVRSASKRDEPLSEAPTALYVITGDEIMNSAATSLPEALRLAPNLEVQQVDARQYAITARGFNSVETSNKLLVLIDGRSIYSTLASSVFWELHNRLVEDIQQIEVISGPGGTLYGANAVNGVVNLITRDASDTLGGLARATAGDEERTIGARVGVPIGTNGAVRFYGSWFDREDLPRGVGPEINDHFRGWQAGFRSDFATTADHLTFQGDIFDTDTNSLPGDGDHGYNLLARWSRDFSPRSALQVQAYYDSFRRRFLLVHDSLETVDLDLQYSLDAGSHALVLGGGARTTRDEFINNLNAFQLDPQSRRLWFFNLFAQDRITLSPAFALILGLKAERTTFTGIQLLPNLRLAWQPDDRNMLWTAVSRAIRTPSRIDRQLANLPFLAPADDFVSEKLIAFEAGYRGQPTPWTTLSVSLFFNLYDDIRTTEFTGNPFPIQLRNGLHGHSYGVEAWSSSQLTPWWRLSLGLSTLWKEFEIEPGRLDLAGGDSLGHDPDYQLFARSQFDLSERWSANAALRWIGEIDANPGIGDYFEADARIAYRLTDNLELYVAGRNLLHHTHAESDDVKRAQLSQRTLYAGARVAF